MTYWFSIMISIVVTFFWFQRHPPLISPISSFEFIYICLWSQWHQPLNSSTSAFEFTDITIEVTDNFLWIHRHQPLNSLISTVEFTYIYLWTHRYKHLNSPTFLFEFADINHHLNPLTPTIELFVIKSWIFTDINIQIFISNFKFIQLLCCKMTSYMSLCSYSFIC